MTKIIMVNVLILLFVIWGLGEPVRAEIERITLRVDGLACPFCAYGLEKKITTLKGVSSYDVDMKEGKVFVGLKQDAQIDHNSLYKAVKEAGFTLKNISLRVKGKIQQSEAGLVLVVGGSQEEFLLFESETTYQKYHQGKPPKVLADNLKKKLIDIKEKENEVLIEGVVHEHKGLPAGLSVEKLEVL